MAVQPKLPAEKKPMYQGQMAGNSQKFAEPFEMMDSGVEGMDGLYDDIGEMSGFEGNTSSYIVKKGVPFGEAAKLNIMPPGMDISDQPNRDIRAMPLKMLIDVSYPGDGWEPKPRDLKEDYTASK